MQEMYTAPGERIPLSDNWTHPPLLNPRCVICGADNPNGLQLEFCAGIDGAEARWIPSEGWESFHGTVHGGVVTAVLDEAMSQAVIARDWQALTVDLRVRFHDRVRPGERLRVHGWIVERRKRRIVTQAKLVSESGVERAHGWGVFLMPSKFDRAPHK
jgi:acyl-coenzyme A thioesterase PaaI-like protein